MKQFIYLTVLLFTLIQCSQKKKSNLLPLALLGGTTNASTIQSQLNASYPDQSNFTITVGQQITLTPSQHVSGATYTVSPALPSGLSINPSTGVISGTPTSTSPQTNYTITQTRPDGSTVSWTIVIGVTGSSGSGSSTVGSTITPSSPSGHYSTPQTINFTPNVSGGEVKCTTDGNDPTSSTSTWTPTHIWSLAGATIKCGTFINGTLSGSIQSYSYSYSPLASSQTACWNSAGTSISCSGTGQDGATQNGVARSYTDNGDGTISDNATGLLWQRCSRGQNNDSTCSGTATTLNFTDSVNYCNTLSLAGKTWKLPNSSELETLPSYGATSPTINSIAFPNTLANAYPSSNIYLPAPTNSWSVTFNDGSITSFPQSGSYNIRCISQQTHSSQKAYTDNVNGTVTDKKSGLIWQKCSAGLSGINCSTGTSTSMNWSSALSYCNSLNLDGRTWRLPSIPELNSLTDKSISTSPTLNTSVFPNTVSNTHWSSTTFINFPNSAWTVTFLSSIAGNVLKTSNFYVRCVSGP